MLSKKDQTAYIFAIMIRFARNFHAFPNHSYSNGTNDHSIVRNHNVVAVGHCSKLANGEIT